MMMKDFFLGAALMALAATASAATPHWVYAKTDASSKTAYFYDKANSVRKGHFVLTQIAWANRRALEKVLAAHPELARMDDDVAGAALLQYLERFDDQSPGIIDCVLNLMNSKPIPEGTVGHIIETALCADGAVPVEMTVAAPTPRHARTAPNSSRGVIYQGLVPLFIVFAGRFFGRDSWRKAWHRVVVYYAGVIPTVIGLEMIPLAMGRPDLLPVFSSIGWIASIPAGWWIWRQMKRAYPKEYPTPETPH